MTLALLPFLLTFFAGAGSIILVIGAAACIVVGIAMTVSLPSGRDPDYRYRMPDDGTWTFVTVTDGVVYR